MLQKLFKLRVLKNVVEKVTKILPEGWIKRVLLEALAGRDVMDQEGNKTMSVANSCCCISVVLNVSSFPE